MKWWDIRNFKSPSRDFLVSVDNIKDGEGVNCLSYDPTIPSKFLIGTAQGSVFSCRMQPKIGSESLFLTTFKDCYHSKVMSVDRNPLHPKSFLTVGGNTVKIWCEDINSSAIMWMKPQTSRFTFGAWSPTRMSLFFTTNTEGTFDIWDFLFRQDAPILSFRLADCPIQNMTVNYSSVFEAYVTNPSYIADSSGSRTSGIG